MYLAVLNFFSQDYNVQRDIQKKKRERKKRNEASMKEIIARVGN